MKYKVFVDVDENGGDDDVFTFSCIVEANSAEEALAKGEDAAVTQYGEDNVLGAYEVREVPERKEHS